MVGEFGEALAQPNEPGWGGQDLTDKINCRAKGWINVTPPRLLAQATLPLQGRVRNDVALPASGFEKSP